MSLVIFTTHVANG